MTSKALSQGAFLVPSSSVNDDIGQQRTSKYRQPSVYDAVAGRISVGGFIPKQLFVSSARDTSSSSITALPPESVLFRSKSAPTRYAEADIYFSNERNSAADLPESDLLKALHCYTSDFYSQATSDGGIDDWKSFDETALIALGILMEEMASNKLGETGDLVFTEAEEIAEPQHRMKSKPRPSKKRRIGGVD